MPMSQVVALPAMAQCCPPPSLFKKIYLFTQEVRERERERQRESPNVSINHKGKDSYFPVERASSEHLYHMTKGDTLHHKPSIRNTTKDTFLWFSCPRCLNPF